MESTSLGNENMSAVIPKVTRGQFESEDGHRKSRASTLEFASRVAKKKKKKKKRKKERKQGSKEASKERREQINQCIKEQKRKGTRFQIILNPLYRDSSTSSFLQAPSSAFGL